MTARIAAETKRPTIYTEAMEVFHRAADLIGLDRRVRMELEEPDYEHIFYVTVKMHTRLVPLPQTEHAKYAQLGFSASPAERNGVALADGSAYFCSRGSLLGQVPGDVVASAFAVFNPSVVVPAVIRTSAKPPGLSRR